MRNLFDAHIQKMARINEKLQYLTRKILCIHDTCQVDARYEWVFRLYHFQTLTNNRFLRKKGVLHTVLICRIIIVLLSSNLTLCSVSIYIIIIL